MISRIQVRSLPVTEVTSDLNSCLQYDQQKDRMEHKRHEDGYEKSSIVMPEVRKHPTRLGYF